MKKTITAYESVYNAIKNAIINGEYIIGELLPPEPALEKKYGVSRITIRKAVELLSNNGYVVVKQGRGTTVTDPNTTQKLNYVTSFSETLKSYGYKLSTNDLHIDEVVPPESVLTNLGLDSGTAVTRIQRLLIANDKPISIVTTVSYTHLTLPTN